MLLGAMKTRLVALPLAALFLLFSGGAAVAPTCHIDAAAQPHAHSAGSHAHSQEAATPLISKDQGVQVLGGQGISYEICAALGFIVLLVIRFLRIKSLTSIIRRYSQFRALALQAISQRLSLITLTHLQLGIIRI